MPDIPDDVELPGCGGKKLIRLLLRCLILLIPSVPRT